MPVRLAFLAFFVVAACGGSSARDTLPDAGLAAEDDARASTPSTDEDARLADADVHDAAIDAVSAAESDAGEPADAGDGYADDGAAPVTGELPIPACAGLGGVDEACVLHVDASGCESAACDRLVVSFSGGDGTCQDSVLAGYASHGYAAVCVQYFETSAGSGAIPYVDEASRMDLALLAATRGSWAKRYWSGAYLVIDGISHGATAPVIAMARTERDTQAHWHGAQKTVACFYDGSYDQAASALLLKTGRADGGPCLLPVPYQRWLARYCGSDANCDLTTNAKALADTITAVDARAFSITDFLMFECGSALAVCAGDILPAAPIEALCTQLARDPAHHCEYRSLPNDSHIACHGRAFDQCRVWADAQFR